MDDTISRQAAIDAAIEAADDWDGGCNIGRQKRIEKYIRQLPSTEPKRGKWKDIVESIEYALGTCDTCGARIPMAYKYYEYCPHCGTKNEVKHG